MNYSGIEGTFFGGQSCIIILKKQPTEHNEQEFKVNEIKNQGFSNASKTDVITRQKSINKLVMERNANNESEDTDINIRRNKIKNLLGKNTNSEIEKEETIEVPFYNGKGELLETRKMTKSEYDKYFSQKVFKVKREQYERNYSKLDLL